MVELSHEWLIEEPSFLPEKNGEIFYSPVFFSKSQDLIRWRLKIFPKGCDEESIGYLSLHLERVFKDNSSDEPPVAVKLSFNVYKNGWKICSHSDELQTLGREPMPSSFGWDKLEKLSILDAIKRPTGTGTDELKITCQLVYAV